MGAARIGGGRLGRRVRALRATLPRPLGAVALGQLRRSVGIDQRHRQPDAAAVAEIGAAGGALADRARAAHSRPGHGGARRTGCSLRARSAAVSEERPSRGIASRALTPPCPTRYRSLSAASSAALPPVSTLPTGR